MEEKVSTANYIWSYIPLAARLYPGSKISM